MATDQTPGRTVEVGAAESLTGEGVAEVDAIVRASGSSFYWAMRLLPAERRQAMFALYAFCRAVDDIADNAGRSDEKRTRLQQWREDIGRLFTGQPIHPVAQALVDPVRHFGLSKEDFLLVIEGMEMDAHDTVRIADMDALRDYCDHVACAVGRLSARIFGLPQKQGEELAEALGQALQLTNILRDLDEDARAGRLYLPQSLLTAHGVAAAKPVAMLADPAISGVCEEMARVARRKFDDTAAILRSCERRRIRPARLMMESYRRVLDRLMRRGWHRRNERMSLPLMQKLWIILRYGLV
jgi:phytoene synthase